MTPYPPFIGLAAGGLQVLYDLNCHDLYIHIYVFFQLKLFTLYIQPIKPYDDTDI